MHGRHERLGCPPHALFEYASELLGHKNVTMRTLVSSNDGQTVFPTIFEATSFLLKTYLALNVSRGSLRHNGMIFAAVEEAWDVVPAESSVSTDPEMSLAGDDSEISVVTSEEDAVGSAEVPIPIAEKNQKHVTTREERLKSRAIEYCAPGESHNLMGSCS